MDKATNTVSESADFNLENGTEYKHGDETVIVWPENGNVVNPVYNDENGYYNFWVQDGSQEQIVKVYMNEEWVSLDLNVDGNSDLKILPGQDLIVVIQNAAITSFDWDASRKELNITADGNGLQEVTVYVNGHGEPKKINFDGTAITSWVYDDTAKTITFTVNLGSPHPIMLSWYVAPVETPSEPEAAPTGGGGGGGKAYYCGDGKCSSKESYCDCAEDCEPTACDGTTTCEGGIEVCTATQAGNGVCEAGENCLNAPGDCPCNPLEECVDGVCSLPAEYCGDGVCQAGEDCRACGEDCGCLGNEACINAECIVPPKCGDGTCNGSETVESCAADCEAQAETEPEQPQGPVNPVGFFGLGLMGDAVGGLLVVIIIVGAAFYIKARA